VSQTSWTLPDRRPRMPVADLFEETLRRYWHNLGLMLAFFALFSLPVIVLSVPYAFWQAQAYQAQLGAAFDEERLAEIWRQSGMLALLGGGMALAGLVVGIFGVAAVTYLAANDRAEPRPGGRDVLATLGRLAGHLLGFVVVVIVASVGFIVILALIIGAILVVLVGLLHVADAAVFAVVALLGIGTMIVAVVVIVRFALVMPVLVIEGRGPVDALRRSWELVRGRGWRTLGIMLLAVVVISFVSGLVSPFYLPGVASGFFTGNSWTYVTVTVAGAVIQVAIGPILPTLLTILYFDYAADAPAAPPLS
jgi:MFS family permease